MTPQEEQLLNSLVERVNQTQLQEKDPDAEGLLDRSLAPNPDALYILAQTVLVQNIALEQAKAQVAQLQQQAQSTRQPAHATSFLGSLLGRHDPEPAALQTAPTPQSQAGYQPVNPQQYVPQYAPQYTQPAPQYAQPQYVPAASGQPSFLRGAVQTAAGVAAGALAFEGVESILHGLGGGGGWGGMGMGPGLMGGGFGRPAEETVINNYYDDPAQGGEHRDIEGGEQHFHESADQGGGQFNDASYNTQGDDMNAGNSANDDNSSGFDNGNVDDGSGFDDSGSFDDGGSGGDLL
ncbi:MAG: DUF2076 domain-containing protein [Terracidiphilus sp.]